MDALMEKLHRAWKLVVANGVIAIIIGLGVFFPVFTHDRFCRLIAAMLILGAVVITVYTLAIHSGRNRIGGLLLAAVRLITALLLLFHPLDTFITFHVLLAIYFGVEGALAIGESYRIKGLKILYPAFLVLGITGVGCSAIIWLFMKGASYFAVSSLLAIVFFVRGGVGIYTGLAVKNYRPVGGATPPTVESQPQAPPQERPAGAQ